MSEQDVTSWLQSLGLAVSAALLDGKFHRVDGKKRGRKAGWYKGWEAPVRNCVAGDWSTGDKWTWSEQATTPADTRKIRKLQREAVALAEEEREREHIAVAESVREKLARATPATADHPYLAAKRVGANGALAVGDLLLVPNCDVDGIVWGAQRIAPNGGKFWHRGQRVSETFFQIGELGDRAFLCEGFATGATIHEATGDAVFCAFAANNLKGTGVALRGKYPDVAWIVAGDDDFETKDNPGRRCAQAAARAIRGAVAFPEFSDGARGTDFNDLMLLHGMEAVTRQLQRTHEPMAVVIDINRGANSGAEKMTKAKFFDELIKKMRGDPLAPADWPSFPHRFHSVADAAGHKSVLEELDDGIVVYRHENVVADAIIKYCWDRIPFVAEMCGVDYEVAKKARNAWLGRTQALPELPAPFLERSQQGLTFKRLPFDLPAGWPGVEPPLFEELLSRCSQPITVCSFIGSLFYPESDRQQYLYLYGEGGEGKGTLMRLLQNVFDTAAESLTPPAKDDRFWNMRVYGKRLGLFYDCDDWKWFGSPHFKSLTGNDPLFVEPKGKSGFSYLPSCKIIAASNSKPRITSQKADLRRLIFVSMRPSKIEQDPTYETRLRAETEAIVRTCKDVYLSQCPNHGIIPFDAALEVALEAEANYLDLFHDNFVVSAEHEVRGESVRQVLLDAGVRSGPEMAAVKACWMRQIDGIEIQHTRRGTRYVGVRKKEAFERQV